MHAAVDLMKADLPPGQARQGRAPRAAKRPMALDGLGQAENESCNEIDSPSNGAWPKSIKPD
jgi:hypothetical protein